MDEATTDRLYRHIYDALDHDNAADLETFGRNFLQNGAVWDRLADLFPTLKSSELRGIMMRAFDQWSRDHANCGHDHGHGHHHH
jgi:hypothetical protein